MSDRVYRVALAATQGGLRNAAPRSQGWTILESTIREFREADSNDDHSLGNIGGLLIRRSGWIALAYQDI